MTAQQQQQQQQATSLPSGDPLRPRANILSRPSADLAALALLSTFRTQADPMNIVKAAYPPPDVYFKRKVALISGTALLLSRHSQVSISSETSPELVG